MTEEASTPVVARTRQSALYAGQVYHKRFRPRSHSLRYRVFSLLLDIDELGALNTELTGFSHNKFNLVSVRDSDFGDPHWTGEKVAIASGSRLRSWVSHELCNNGLHDQPTQILLSCYPRVLGLAFNPLSLFYCLDETGHVYAVIHEVHNTFGERHAYVLGVTDSPDSTVESTEWIEQHVDKALFVSPFVQMGMHYRFRLNEPASRQVIAIHASDDEGVLLTASYVASRHRLSERTLFAHVVRLPWLAFKVVGGIHWEALKLWVKRVPWFRHQPKRIV